MRIITANDMFLNKDYFGAEPADAQIYLVITFLPWMFKLIYGLIIDSRLVPKRKYYLIFFGILSVLSQFAIGFGKGWITEHGVVACMMIYNLSAAFLDATIDSIYI